MVAAVGGVRARVSRRELRILLFHDIPFAQRPAFRALVEYLALDHRFVPPSRLGEVLAGEAPHGVELLATFDDGFRSNLWAAREVLAPLGIRAVFFVSSDFPDCDVPEAARRFVGERIFGGRMRAEDVPESMAPMTWAELATLREDGHAIGSHSATHVRLSTLTDAAMLEAEIAGSGARISAKLGTLVEHFAYPFGDIESITSPALAVARAQYRWVHSGVRGPNRAGTQPGALRRESFAPTDDPRYVRAVIAGGLDWRYIVRRRRLDAMASA